MLSTQHPLSEHCMSEHETVCVCVCVCVQVVLKPPFGLEGNKNAPVKETKVKEIDAATILEELLFSR